MAMRWTDLQKLCKDKEASTNGTKVDVAALLELGEYSCGDLRRRDDKRAVCPSQQRGPERFLLLKTVSLCAHTQQMSCRSGRIITSSWC